MNDYQSLSLRKKLANDLFNCQIAIQDTIQQGVEWTVDEINQSFDDVVNDFLNDNFNNADEKQEWYENVAMDLMHTYQLDCCAFLSDNS